MSYVSECLVLSGCYLISRNFTTLGGALLGLGIAGGTFSFLFNMTIANGKEKRSAEIYEFLKASATKFLQAADEINTNFTNRKTTVH